MLLFSYCKPRQSEQNQSIHETNSNFHGLKIPAAIWLRGFYFFNVDNFMQNPIANSALAQTILAAIESGTIPVGYILGATLGMVLKKHVHIDLKEHGGLREFCEGYVAQSIKYLGRIAPKTGDSLFYVHENTRSYTDWWKIDPINAKLIWDFYSNPLLCARLAVNLQEASCWVTLNPTIPTKPDTTTLSGISIAMLESLIPQYYNQCPAELKPAVTDARKIATVVGPSLAQAWPTIIQTAKFAPVLGAWEQWLLQTPVKLDTNEAAPAWLTELLSNCIQKQSQLRLEFSGADTMPLPTRATNIPHAVQGSTNTDSVSPKLREARAIAINVVQGMSYEQLRELNLPFGMVLDALAGK